ncbi:regulator of microtubule dynamics protein 2 [Erpetoichthys calabaricus]|uniref:regulator of microtubule dynamics protein 2 n=1 Tax=Erpetoichthys calabaricus TaxID=27687 RepID=UPI0022344B21|nr:regulator of microtubule dynamics protein 2 [Erpetoichthys calabaricus]XP_051775276.1 regulator of microtubule dynamics protein 2 [Erpetoichthys calabaricus]
MSESNSKVTVLTVMAGAAGITLAFMWFKRNGIFSQKVYSPQLCISNNKDQHSLAHVDGGSGGPALLLQGRPVDVLEKLNALIACVSELKEEVRSLKEAIPKLNERVCTEVFQKGVRKASPQHRGSRRKKAETFRDDYMSSEDAESENGYVTAHTDTEDESDEGPIATVKPFSEDDLLDKADEFTFFIHKADNLHRGSEAEKKEGFMMLLEKKNQYGDKVPYLWRLARSYGDMFDSTTESEDKKNYAETGKIFAEDAIKLDSMSAESHQWFAIMCGYMSEYESVQNKIKNGYLFKDHLDKAIELKPQDPQLYYLLGRWCYAVSQLSWLERKVAATLFGNPPSATIHDALQYFHKAEEIHPHYSKFNCVFLAKCYKHLGQTVNALKWCDAAASMKSASKEDKEAQKELESIQSSLCL